MRRVPAVTPQPAIDEPPPSFEVALSRLEQSVAALESGALDLDAALATYESGLRMYERCQTLLDAAEVRVNQVLGTRPDGTIELGAFPMGTDPETP